MTGSTDEHKREDKKERILAYICLEDFFVRETGFLVETTVSSSFLTGDVFHGVFFTSGASTSDLGVFSAFFANAFLASILHFSSSSISHSPYSIFPVLLLFAFPLPQVKNKIQKKNKTQPSIARAP